MATCMIVTLNHGNINVIFSIVALSFILDIDGDCRLLVLHASAVSAACVASGGVLCYARARAHTHTHTHTHTSLTSTAPLSAAAIKAVLRLY